MRSVCHCVSRELLLSKRKPEHQSQLEQDQLVLDNTTLKMTDMEGLEEEVLSDVDLKEKEFHGIVREITILCLISIILYIGSFAFLNFLR